MFSLAPSLTVENKQIIQEWHTEFDMDKLTTHNTYLNSLYICSYKQRDNMNFNVTSDKLGIMQNLYLSKNLWLKLK